MRNNVVSANGNSAYGTGDGACGSWVYAYAAGSNGHSGIRMAAKAGWKGSQVAGQGVSGVSPESIIGWVPEDPVPNRDSIIDRIEKVYSVTGR